MTGGREAPHKSWRPVGQGGQPGVVLYCPTHPDAIRFFKTSSNRAPACPVCHTRLKKLEPPKEGG